MKADKEYTRKIAVALKPDLHDALLEAANTEKDSISEWVRGAIVEKLDKGEA